MTTPQSPAQPEPKVKKRLKVEPEEAGQLEQLLVAYRAAKDAADVAGERADDLKRSIKGFLLSLFPGGEGLPDSFDIVGDAHGRYPGYTMSLRGGFRLDTEALKTHAAEVYVQYARKVEPSWDLREAAKGRRRG